MGVVHEEGTNRLRALSGRVLIGRAASCSVPIAEGSVSAEHAVVYWQDGWYVRDLASRNGTYLDGQRLEPGTSVLWGRAQILVFGGARPWTLMDDGPPGLVVVPRIAGNLDTRRATCSRLGLLGLPDRGEPLVTFRERGGNWVVETEATEEPAEDRAEITIGGRTWQVLVPGRAHDVAETSNLSAAPQIRLHTSRLYLRVSPDEERVRMEMHLNTGVRKLRRRSHGYLLVTLARLRLRDRQRGLAADDAGWVETEQLLAMLKLNRSALNTLVYRAREQFSGLGLPDGGEIITRRPSMDLIRIGVEDLVVETAEVPR